MPVIIEAYISVIMEGFRDQFTTTVLLSYKEVLYEEATEEWYAQRDPAEVDREDRNCIRLAQQFGHLMKEYRERFLTNTERSRTSRELPLTHVLYISVG